MKKAVENFFKFGTRCENSYLHYFRSRRLWNSISIDKIVGNYVTFASTGGATYTKIATRMNYVLNLGIPEKRNATFLVFHFDTEKASNSPPLSVPQKQAASAWWLSNKWFSKNPRYYLLYSTMQQIWRVSHGSRTKTFLTFFFDSFFLQFPRFHERFYF